MHFIAAVPLAISKGGDTPKLILNNVGNSQTDINIKKLNIASIDKKIVINNLFVSPNGALVFSKANT